MNVECKKFKLKDGVILTEDLHIIKFDSGEIYKINHIAKEIFEMWKKTCTLKEITKKLLKKYNGYSYETLSSDIRSFAEFAIEEGLLVEVNE